MKWVALFSQTGTELYEVSQRIGRYPDIIICNKENYDGINENILGKSLMLFTEKKPTVEDYRELIPKGSLVTMHGWLRIVPPEICNEFNIFNGHPGDIVTYPELKGKDPQKKAFDLKLQSSGCIIHRATAEVDSGEIVLHRNITIQGLSLDDVFKALHKTSINLWIDFLKAKLKYE